MQDTQTRSLQRTKSYSVLYSDALLKFSLNSFVHFFYGIYALGVARARRHFAPGMHLTEWAYRIQNFKRTATVAPRKHIKTTLNLGYIAWQLFRMAFLPAMKFDEILYMSYLEDNAGYQLRWLKRYLAFIPFFEQYRNLTLANSIMHYSIEGREFICAPCGILAFKRGQHPRVLVCDDILKDPKEKKMNPAVITEINRIFAEEVESMPTEELHVFGTPQSNGDLFAKLEKNPAYNFKRYPAEKDPKRQIALWPEVFPWEKLKQTEASIGRKAYNKEYLCMPVRGEEGFFTSRILDEICKGRLRRYELLKKLKLREMTFAGLDIGKKTHPSHLTVLAVDRKGRLVQVHDKWFDGWDYQDQIEYCRRAIDIFGIEKLLYDDTRAEFEGFKEAGTLPDVMEGLPMTGKLLWEMASALDARVTAKKLWLLNIPRSKGQLLNVDNDLKAPETDEGHADNFSSLMLAVRAYDSGSSELVREV